jgi:DNA-binding CsgD family transcriptional regulator/uncharacterized protein YqgC (DUF456 family)
MSKGSLAMGRMDVLTQRERDVVDLLLRGKGNRQIATSLGISVRTVEFHLTNVYSKLEVGSRVELIVKLRAEAFQSEHENPVYSTVEGQKESHQDRDKRKGQGAFQFGWGGRSAMTQQLRHHSTRLPRDLVVVSVAGALLGGSLWVALLRRFGHMVPSDVLLWVVPLILTLSSLGVSVAFVGGRTGSTRVAVSLASLFGSVFGAIAILPAMGLLVLPLAKLAEWFHIVDRSAMSADLAQTLVVLSMLAIWFVFGAALGIGFQMISGLAGSLIQTRDQTSQRAAS